MGGEIPPPTPRERLEAQRAKLAAGEAAATEAEERTRATHEAAPLRRAATIVSDTTERLSAAAGVLGVPIEADSRETRQAYLRAAIRAHPDKGGSNAAFRGLLEAYQLLEGAPDATRRDASQEIRNARSAAQRAQRDARDTATQRALRLQNEVTHARAEASRRAEAAWVPPWRAAAQHLRTASGAYMELWTEYQRHVTRRLNELARSADGGGYATHGERQIAAAAQRRAQQRHARDVARLKAVTDMRDAEKRAAHASRAAATAAAKLLRQESIPWLVEAAHLDSNVLMQDYRVKVPYALWEGHPDGTLDRHELYEISEVDSHWVTIVRSAASAAERKLPLGQAGWHRFQVSWDCLTGARRYGPDQRGLVIVPRSAADATSEEEAEASDDECQHEAREERRAIRTATQLINAARAADRNAARLLREEARQEKERAEADDAMQHELANDAHGGTDGSDSDRPEDRLAAATDHGTQQAISAQRRGAWSGKNWAKEAWTGPVAAAEYAEAWRRGPLPRPPGSAAADAARRAAQQASLDANVSGHTRAVETAAQETSRRTKRLWGAAEDAAAMCEQQRATDFLADFVRQWREREPPAPQHHDIANATQAAAATAADDVQRRRPAKDTVAAANRKRVMIDAARFLASAGAHRDPASDAAVAHAQRHLHQDAGRREAQRLMAAVLECLPDQTGAPHFPAPNVPGVRALHTDATDTTATHATAAPRDTRALPRRGTQDDGADLRAAAPDPETSGEGAESQPTTLTASEGVRRAHITIHVGNMRTEGRTGRRPEGAEDRRVDRGTPFGNPFPIDPTDDQAREAACDAYAALLQGDPAHIDVMQIAARYGLRVDQRYAPRRATHALHRALRQLERDVSELQPGKSIRLMCHCAPKRCHAHVIAHDIRLRLRARGIHIEVDGNERGGPEGYGEDGISADGGDEGEAAEMGDADASAGEHADDPDAPTRGQTDTTREPFALIDKLHARRTRLRNKRTLEAAGVGDKDADAGGHTGDSVAPDRARTGTAREPSALIDKLLARLNRLRNKRAFEEFMRTYQRPDDDRARPHSSLTAGRSSETGTSEDRALGTTRAQRQKTTHSDGDDDEQAHDADDNARGDGSEADKMRAVQRAKGSDGPTSGTKPTVVRAAARKKAAVAKAAAARAARATAAMATGMATMEAATGAAVIVAAAATASRAAVTGAEAAAAGQRKVPSEGARRRVGDGGSEANQRHEGGRGAEGREAIDGGEQRSGGAALEAEGDDGDEAMEGDEDSPMQRVEGDSGSTGANKQRKPKRRAKGEKSQQQRQDGKRTGGAREA